MAQIDFARDGFDTLVDRFAGDPLQTGTADDGGTWTLHSTSAGNAAIVGSPSYRIRGDNSSDAVYYHSGTPLNANYTVEAYVVQLTSTAPTVGVCARMDTVADTFYEFRLFYLLESFGSDRWTLIKCVAGTFTTLASGTTSFDTSRFAITVDGTTIKGYVGSTEVASVTDSDITDAGKAGIRTVGATTDSTGSHLDDFRAYYEIIQYETPNLLITTTNASPEYNLGVAYETPTNLINTRFVPTPLNIPTWTNSPSNVYETPWLLITSPRTAPDYTIGEAGDGDGAHPLFWLNNQDWGDPGANVTYETPWLLITSPPTAPEWSRVEQQPMETPGLLISFAKVAPQYQSVPVGVGVTYETPGLVIQSAVFDPTYSLIQPEEPIFGVLTGVVGHKVRLTGTMGHKPRLTGVAGRSNSGGS